MDGWIDKMKWDEMRWDEVRWGEMRWDEIRWDEVRWGEMRWDEMRWGEMRWGEMRWGEMRWYRLYYITLNTLHYHIVSKIVTRLPQNHHDYPRSAQIWVPCEKSKPCQILALFDGYDSLRLATCGYGQNTVDLWPIEARMGGQAFDEHWKVESVDLSWCNVKNPIMTLTI